MRVLIVDDDPAILHLCATALRNQGHDVRTCGAGGEAIAAALTGSFDLALCDINLPDVHGLEIVRAIKLQAPGLPVIVMSALDPREWRDKSVEAGASHFLSKPLRLETLRHEVRMAQASMLSLAVVLYLVNDGSGQRERLEQAFGQAGFPAFVAESASEIVEAGRLDPSDVVILDAAAPGADRVLAWARDKNVHCFVLVEPGQGLDDALMRRGASLMVEKPIDPEALLLQARFLARK